MVKQPLGLSEHTLQLVTWNKLYRACAIGQENNDKLPLRTSQRPFVFPTASTSLRGGEPIIVTGVAIPAENDVIDLTVTAQQGFGARRPKPKKKYSGFDRIITKARPGDQFVSIDGKRTYFDIGPSRAPVATRGRPRVTGQVIGATLQLGGQNVLSPTKTRIRPTASTRQQRPSPSKSNFASPSRKNF